MRLLKRGVGWVLMCRESASQYEKSIIGKANSSVKIHELVRERILREQCEVMYALALDGRNRVIAMVEVARGGLHGCAISARDILRPMIACGACAFVLVHNHPSGNPTPSPEDIAMTKLTKKAADVVDVPLVDHVIVGSWESYSSLLDLGLL